MECDLFGLSQLAAWLSTNLVASSAPCASHECFSGAVGATRSRPGRSLAHFWFVARTVELCDQVFFDRLSSWSCSGVVFVPAPGPLRTCSRNRQPLWPAL